MTLAPLHTRRLWPLSPRDPGSVRPRLAQRLAIGTALASLGLLAMLSAASAASTTVTADDDTTPAMPSTEALMHSATRRWHTGDPVDATALAGKSDTAANGAPLEGPGSLTDKRAMITADELVHDKDMHTVTARGGVEIQYAGRILLADTVNYQMDKDYATASGHVVILEQDGSTMFADHVELNDKLKDGFVEQVRILLADGSRAAANKATRTGGNVTTMDHAVYSACNACSQDPSAPPLWQIKALRVIHDQKEQTISYRDAWLELGGVPVFYTPYLSHPDPSVKRRSGFLAPTYGGTSDLGATLTVPYYFAISPYQDATFSPMFTTEEGVVLAGQYRYNGDKGFLRAEGSITQNSEDEIRNHLRLNTQIALDETWRAGAEIALTSDDSYLGHYGYHSQSFLTSRPYLEGFSRRSYAVVDGYFFQDLRDSTTSTAQTPVVLPEAEWSYSSAPNNLGAYHTADVSFVAVSRDDSKATSSRRLSASYGYHLPYIGPIGDVYQLDLNLRGDAYNVQDVTLDDGSLYSGNVGRLIPKASFTWSLPFDRQHATFQEVFTPITQLVVSPRGQNSDKIPNEDSVDFEFDDTNLFTADRFTGYDRVEGGTRVNYGFRYGAYNNKNGRFNLSFGQSWHATKDGIFSSASGLDEKFSDYVGRAEIRPSENVDLLYRFRLDKDNFQAHRNELGVRVGPPVLRLSTTYTMLDGNTLTGEDADEYSQEELKVGLSSHVNRYWTVEASTINDLTDDGGPLKTGFAATYDDDCFTMGISAYRDFTYDGDEDNDGYEIGLRIVLKTLGEIQTSASP